MEYHQQMKTIRILSAVVAGLMFATTAAFAQPKHAIAMQGELSADLEQALRETVQEFKSGAWRPG